MSDLFENIDLQMQEDAKEKNPRSAILASQMETEKRFSKFIDENPNRVSIIEDEIKNVTDKYAYQYEVDPQLVYQETVSYLTKNAIMFDDVEEEEVGILPGIRESLTLMMDNGFNELAQKWEDRVSAMSIEEQVDIYPEVIDSFVEAVESSPQTEMWDMDPNQYDEWDKTSSAHRDLSDEELLNKIKEHVTKLKRLDEPVDEDLEELHQELWDRSGHGDKWRNRKQEEKEGEEKTAAGDYGNYVAYQIKGNDHFLCPHCAHEMSGEDLNWEDNLSGISRGEMEDIKTYLGHSGKCDQCGMDLFENQPKESSTDGFMTLGHKLVEMAEQAGHKKLADKWVQDWMNPETSAEGAHEKIASAARQLWEVLKGDRRPEVREFYSNNKDELVNLMTQANALAYEIDPSRVSKREASVASFVGIEDQFIQKEAMEIYGGPIWDEVKRRWQSYPVGTRWNPDVEQNQLGRPDPYPAGVNQKQQYAIPDQTWHDYIMRSNLWGQKGYPLNKKPEVDIQQGQPLPPQVEEEEDVDPRVLTGDRMTNTRITHFTPIEQRLIEVYMNKGLDEKYASIIVESVGEMAQLQVDAPGLPVADSECETISPDKEIGGAEGDKYKNLDVAQKQKELGLEHQEFTDFGEPVREFIQPGGEAPYSENTKKKIDEGAESVDMNKKKVKQEDNAPKR